MGAYRPPGARSLNDSVAERATLASLSSNLKSSRSIPGLNKGNIKFSDKKGSRGNKFTKSQPPPKPASENTASTGLVNKDPEKRIKVLKKKLKQIEDIKARVSGGEQVELTQIQKLDSEATILKEVLDLFFTISWMN